TITFSIEQPGAATIITTGTIVNGVATAYFTSTTVGSVQVQAQVTVGGTLQYLDDQAFDGKDYVTINFTIPPPNTSTSYITPVIASTAADGTSKDEVEAYVVG